MENKKFKRVKENFICEKCGFLVVGNGYTNHCNVCLWSKHVDINPGDGKNICLGIMEPTRIEGSTGKYRVLHKCLVCDFEKYNNIVDRDNFDTLINITEKHAKKFSNQL